ncbi:MAG: hypothetical protein WBZ01_21920 [Terriglobales bacterium]|jgi:hypothetical protein
MSDDKMTNQPTIDPASNHEGFEHEDMNSKGPLYFMAGLILLCAAIYLIVFGMYRFLDSYASAHQPPMSPMVAPEANTRMVTPEDPQTFPQPRLEVNERTELRSFIEDQDRLLATYGWVDKNKGIVRIPIDRAMELIAKRGLPVHPEGAALAPSSAAQTSAPVKKQTPKARTSKPAASGN